MTKSELADMMDSFASDDDEKWLMLDSDLAKIYGYEVKRLNEQVKRNIKRFPEDFMFQLVESEIPDSLKSQFATLNINENKRGMHIKKMPYVFTEQGIYMLATVLKGELAEQQSIFIMRAFKEMRHYIRQNRQFVTQSEMNLVTAKVSELSVQMADVVDRQKQTEKSMEEIRKSIDVMNENFITEKDFKNFVIYVYHSEAYKSPFENEILKYTICNS